MSKEKPDRKEITKLLTEVLIGDRLNDRKYYAKEVTLDFGTNHPKRIDVVQFLPKGVTYASDMEKGIFICYEIKSCKADIYSGNGLNFYGEKNFIVTTILTFENGFVPTLEETLKAAGISEEEYQLLLELPTCDLSLDQEINPDDGDGDVTLLNFYVKQDDVTSEEECVIQERNELLMECIRSLSHSNQEVIDRRFGLTTGIRESLAMIANDMGVSRERIRQKEKESLRKLRKKQKLKQYVLGEF